MYQYYLIHKVKYITAAEFGVEDVLTFRLLSKDPVLLY